MKEGEDMKRHLDQLYHAVDKLSEIDIEINNGLLATQLWTLLLSPSNQGMKTQEESEARGSRNVTRQEEDGMMVKRMQPFKNFKGGRRANGKAIERPVEGPKYRWYRCKKVRYKIISVHQICIQKNGSWAVDPPLICLQKEEGSVPFLNHRRIAP